MRSSVGEWFFVVGIKVLKVGVESDWKKVNSGAAIAVRLLGVNSRRR